MDFRNNEYLTVDHRRRMNSLVDLVNSKVRAAAQRAGDKVVFVDWDEYVGMFHGRYCEPGVNEASDEAKARPGLMFYEMNALDVLGKSSWKRSEETHAQDTFAGELNILSWLTTKMDPEAKFRSVNAQGASSTLAISALAAADPGDFPDHVDVNLTTAVSFAALADNMEIGVPNFLPDGYGRVFHPTILAHNLIANKVIWHMMNEKTRQAGYEGLQEKTLIGATCPVIDNGPVDPPSFYARIMPLGASIVYGYGSDSGNGFRKPLRDVMRQDNWKVNMVGDHNAGSMVDSVSFFEPP